ncbi:hypothetical protein [Streptomyces cinereospinus]|uniref:Uncharacterized protein n=1 Tax=Streptomyces cinereospinus TaxID=285561 RepID=A0ABV5N2L8_9ACTN
MPVRPRCPRGHFLARTGTCRCLRTDPHTTTHTDLQGQGRRIRYRDLETVQLGGEYL